MGKLGNKAPALEGRHYKTLIPRSERPGLLPGAASGTIEKAINKALLFLKITLNLVGAPGFEPEPRAPKARMPALTPYPAMVGSAALESASQPFQGCATPSQLTPQTLTHDPLLQDEEGTRGYGVFLFLRSNRSLHHSSNDGEDSIRTSFKDSRPVIEHPALTR